LKLDVPMQLGLWEDETPLEDPASAVSAVSYSVDPLTAAVSPLAAPPQSATSSTASVPDPALLGQILPEQALPPVDGPLASLQDQAGTSTGRVPHGHHVSHGAHVERHPVCGLPWFRHPQAVREIRLGKAVVSYEIKRARRHSIGMVVGLEGLSVRAPRWVSPTDIETALRAKERWICTKLVEQRERAHKQASARIEWREGATVPYLGDEVVLVLDPRVDGAALQRVDATMGDQTLPGVARHTLRLGLQQDASPAHIRDAVMGWLQDEAIAIFKARVQHYADRLGVDVSQVKLSSAKTRWGSASADGSIRLHWRLVHFGISIIDYVVAHELSHLREMNHSPRFWAVVRSLMPDYDAPREQLRHVVIPD
jgi:predicted metal-dependent hydrolase